MQNKLHTQITDSSISTVVSNALNQCRSILGTSIVHVLNNPYFIASYSSKESTTTTFKTTTTETTTETTTLKTTNITTTTTIKSTVHSMYKKSSNNEDKIKYLDQKNLHQKMLSIRRLYFILIKPQKILQIAKIFWNYINPH